jgi:glyoxylase-like metal-dependent hydrolase (beta-lactamase superfamily II)
MTTLKELKDLLLPNEQMPLKEWQLKIIQSDQCQSYLAWNEHSREALLIDPKREDLDAYLSLIETLPQYIWLGVIDTHTHADHISAAAHMAEVLKTPLLMHHLSPSTRAHLRIAHATSLPSRACPIQIMPTPGHTPDGICVVWGPFTFTGDTVLYADVGRDDLPGGDAQAHYESIQKLKVLLAPETLILPGHDCKGGRISSWATQLKINSSLTQEKELYVEESVAFDAPAPALFKKSLVENFK